MKENVNTKENLIFSMLTELKMRNYIEKTRKRNKQYNIIKCK